MAGALDGKTIAFLTGPEGTEQVELTEPWRAVKEAGGAARLVSTELGTVQLFNHLEKGDTFDVDLTVDEASADDFDGLSLPGGVANPDFLRTQPAAVAFVKAFFDAGKPVSAICHAAWTLIEADVVRGRDLASWPSLQTDLRNAGATWHDKEVVVYTAAPSTLVTSRNPDDIAAYSAAAVRAFGGDSGPSA